MAKELDKKQVKSLERVLIENFISLQRVMVNLSARFDELSNKISRLLELFEISAKTLAERKFPELPESKILIEKIDRLSEQNKTIAKGLSLMYEKLPTESKFENQSKEIPHEYQKSIEVGESDFSPAHKKFKPLPKR